MTSGRKELLQSGDSLDIGGYTVPNVAGTTGNYLVMGASNSEWQELNNAYDKTGWDESVFSEVTLTFTDGTRTVAIAPTGASASYYIGGIKYTFTVEQTVVIDDTEGLWYIYFDGSTLTASQTPWTYDDTQCMVMSLYWDAANKINIGWESELHSWILQERLHNYLHDTFGTRYDSGLGVAEATTSTVNVAIGRLFDEDVLINITDEVGSGWWDQILSPLTAPIYYREGAGLWRKIAASTSLCYLDTNIPQVNILSGTWQWAVVGTNKYFAYWVVASGDNEYPVYIVPGQEASDKLSDTISGNLLADMSFEGLPTEEHKVIARLILRRTGSGAFYEITQIDDYRYAKDENAGAGTTVSDHGGLTGLADDDHAQYHNDARATTWIDAGFNTTGAIKINADSVKHYFGESDDYSIEWDGDNAVHTIAVTSSYSFVGGAITVPNVTTAERDALTEVDGMVIYNTTLDEIQFYEDGIWASKVAVITEDTNFWITTTGNNTTGDGSIGTPWATLDHALSELAGFAFLALVYIYIEKGTYVDASLLHILHPYGINLRIIGDSVEESLTMTASGGSAGTYWYTFATANTDDYTVGDYTLNWAAAGGSNPDSTLGVLECISKVNGVSVTLQSKVTATLATGAVVAELVTPQVKFSRSILIGSTLANLEGIQLHYNATSSFAYLIRVDAEDAGATNIEKTITINTNASQRGICRSSASFHTTVTKCGGFNMYAGWFADGAVTLYTCGMNSCTSGLRAYGGSAFISYITLVLVDNTTGLRADITASINLGGGTLTNVGNGTDASPAAGSQGNQFAYVST